MFVQGELYWRRDLHRQFGGQQQGGISTPKQHPIILLFTGETGEQYGYRDDWTPEGVFLYTGEGRAETCNTVVEIERSVIIYKTAKTSICSNMYEKHPRVLYAMSTKWCAPERVFARLPTKPAQCGKQ